MKTTTHKTVTTLLRSLTLATLIAASAAAAGPTTYLVTPGESYGLPKFGFSSSNIGGYGERVVFVRYGSRAAQLGLEPGDVILSLNGYALTYRGSWSDALSRALYEDGGLVRIRVRDVRTGYVVSREIFVGDSGIGGGPVVHYNIVKPHVNHHNNLGLTLKTIGKFVD
jgi:predicted metalloprotease with PDZ domain